MSIIEKKTEVCGKIEAVCQEAALYFSRKDSFLSAYHFRRCGMPKLKTKTDPVKEAFFTAVEELTQVLPAETIRTMAKETDFIKRIRKIDPALFFWNLIMGFGIAMEPTLAALRRRMELIADVDLMPSSFFDKFNIRLVAFLESILKHLIQNLAVSSLPRNILTKFIDVYIIDNTIVQLQDGLAKIFPGVKMAAGAKISVVLSVACESIKRVTIHAGKKADIKTIELGDWVKDHLLLFDMGFFKGSLFHNIKKWGGHFITRLKSNMNPEIIANNRPCRGKAIDLVGKRLKDVIGKLKREVLDVTVALPCNFRSYAGQSRKTTIEVRLVGMLNDDTGEYHLYITDLDTAQFPAEQIAALYRGRWAVELLFKELKSRYALQTVLSEKPEVVKAMILSAMITLVISRRLFVGYRDAMAKKKLVVSRKAWATFLAENAKDVLRIILRIGKIEFTEDDLWRLALTETFDRRPQRDKLDDVWDM